MNVILGTAGHIDHGKSSLIKALTGIDPDRLPEEKARGVTIELGFAHLTIPHPKGHDDFQVGVIDVPGHADFINNMVAGVGALDIALFVVAADDCWMPQSEEHLHVLSYLGVKNAVIALTKSDICEDIEFTTEILREELEGSLYENTKIIPVSSHTGEGLDELRAELSQQFYEITSKRSTAANRRPRLSIDRAFSPTGIGTVVTGTLAGGPVSIGDTLTLQPEGQNTSIRQIQNHSSQLDTGLPGMRTALNVPDLTLAERGKPGAHRGSSLVEPDSGPTTEIIDVLVTRMDRQIPGQSQSLHPLKLPRKIIVHMGTAHLSARLISLDKAEIMPGEKAFCELRFDQPVHCFTGDHFVIRDASKLSTLAGGIVLDALADRRRFHRSSQLQLLETRATDPENPDVLLTSLLTRDHILPSQNPAPLSPFTNAAMEKSVAKLKKNKKIITIGDYLVSPEWWKSISVKAADIIHSWHKSQPDQPGIEVSQLLTKLKDDLTSPGSDDLIIQGLVTRGFVKRGDQIASEDHHLSLPPELERTAAAIKVTLAKDPRNPPTKSLLLQEPDDEKAYKYLIRSKELVELDAKTIVSMETYQKMATEVQVHLTEQTQSTASELRQMLGTSRKVLMPFLERLDLEGVTQRQGDVRILKSQ